MSRRCCDQRVATSPFTTSATITTPVNVFQPIRRRFASITKQPTGADPLGRISLRAKEVLIIDIYRLGRARRSFPDWAAAERISERRTKTAPDVNLQRGRESLADNERRQGLSYLGDDARRATMSWEVNDHPVDAHAGRRDGPGGDRLPVQCLSRRPA